MHILLSYQSFFFHRSFPGPVKNSKKIANIIPGLKKGDSYHYNNYHSISLISNLSKLIEKLTHKRFFNFLEKYSLLFEKQYGFCVKMFTNHALIDITNKIQEACDKGSFACGVFLDFKKAFNAVNHNIYFTN